VSQLLSVVFGGIDGAPDVIDASYGESVMPGCGCSDGSE
jgi:hypothetical protein